jgi:type II secretory pathway predicted ATPase ExeA
MQPILTRFGLARAPFTKELAAGDLFSPTHITDAVTRLRAAVESRSSAVLTGDSGVGKTCVLRGLEAMLNPARFRLLYLHHANVSSRDFYRQVSVLLGLEPKSHPSAMFRQIQAQMEELSDQQKVHPVLMLDEAQLVPLGMLEQLHILMNFRMDSAAFLSVVLVGLPELKERLARNVLSSLSTRLPTRVHLEPLGVDNVADYIAHRMRVAGATAEVFSRDAVLSIREATGGVMRKIDVLAAQSLEVALQVSNGNQASLIDGTIVQKAVRLCAEALR